MTLWTVLLVAGAYLVGSIPTGYWLGLTWKRVDIRQHGSGNLGATNVFRVLGTAPGLLTLVIDIVKGVIAVSAARHVVPGAQGIALICGLASVLGHTTSPFVGFRGGKGVATSAGVFLALTPLPALIAIATFAISLWLSRFVSVSSMAGALALAGSTWGLCPVQAFAWAATGIAVFVVWTHRSNIRRLMQGTELKIGQKVKIS